MATRTPNVLLIALMAATTIHCSSSTSTSSCTNIAGTWSVSGCASFQCKVTQSDCSVSIGCPLISYTGSVSGDSVSFQSFAGDGGVTQACQGTLSGMTLMGTCTSGGTPCTFAAVKQ
jgi:hypothetical protein